MRNIVYTLSADLAKNPQRVKSAQTVTKDRSRPASGLKGSHGLFGSIEWWRSIEQGVIRRTQITGVIKRLYVAGQDSGTEPNEFELQLEGGGEHYESIYVNCEEDVRLFRIGSVIEIVYISDELKARNEDGTARYFDLVIEMAVYD